MEDLTEMTFDQAIAKIKCKKIKVRELSVSSEDGITKGTIDIKLDIAGHELIVKDLNFQVCAFFDAQGKSQVVYSGYSLGE